MGFGNDGAPDWLHNFAPLAAIALCGGFYLPARLAVAIPLVAMFASDTILNVFRYDAGVFYAGQWVTYAALAAVLAIGMLLRKTRVNRRILLVGGSLVGSVLFYLATTAGSWFANPVYAKDLAGFIQACTVGDPSVSPPAWVFFRNSLVSDLIYTTLFIACMSLTLQRTSEQPDLSDAELEMGSDGSSVR